MRSAVLAAGWLSLFAGGCLLAASADHPDRLASVSRRITVEPAGEARELSRREVGGALEIGLTIDLPTSRAAASASSSVTLRVSRARAGAVEREGDGEAVLILFDALDDAARDEARPFERSVDLDEPPGARMEPRRFRLGAPIVVDAAGRSLPAHLKTDPDPEAADDHDGGTAVTILVESEEAAFPLSVALRLIPVEEGSKTEAPDPSTPGARARTASPLLAPPSNDDCSGAIVIPNASLQVLTAPVDAMDATITGDPVFCVTTDRSLWYVYTAPVTVTYTFTTCAAAGALGTTMPDTVLAVLATGGGCAALGGGVACNDDDPACSGGGQATIVTTLTGGQSYYIVAARYAGVGQVPISPGATTIQILVARGSSNDACTGPVPALTLDIPVNGTTLAASNDFQLTTGSPNGYQLPGPTPPVGQTVSAAAGRDIVYSFTAPSTGAYSFRVTGYSPVQNAVLYVSSTCPSGAPPVGLGTPPCVGAANRTTTSGPTAEEVMCLPMTEAQTNFVIVDDAVANNEGSAFRLEVNRCAREAETNNTPGTANAVACGLEGSVNPAANVDFFALGSPPAGSRVFSLADGVAENNNDQKLRVTTSVDTLEFDDDNNFLPFGSLSPNVAGTPLTGAPSFLRIDPVSASTPEEPYRLYAVVQPPFASATAEVEPNDGPASAGSSATNYFRGALAAPAPSSDVDVYRFRARAGTLIMLNLDGDPLRDNTPIDPKLELLDAAGGVLISVNDAWSTSSTATGAGSLTATTPFSPGEGLTYRSSVTGDYYARVSIGTTSATPTGAGDYLLSISLDCAAGDQDVDGVGDAKDCAPASASTWSLPSAARGLILTGKSPTTLAWQAPLDPGTTGAITYDALRANAATGFGAALCLASDIAGTGASDAGARPSAGSAYFYLVRTQNTCGGYLGATSTGVPRTGVGCP